MPNYSIISVDAIQWNLWYKTLQSEIKGSYNGGGLILEVIFSMIKHSLFNKTWSDNGGGLIPGGLIPEVPLY